MIIARKSVVDHVLICCLSRRSLGTTLALSNHLMEDSYLTVS